MVCNFDVKAITSRLLLSSVAYFCLNPPKGKKTHLFQHQVWGLRAAKDGAKDHAPVIILETLRKPPFCEILLIQSSAHCGANHVRVA